MTDQVLLRDLVDDPGRGARRGLRARPGQGGRREVHDHRATWSPTQLAASFDQALGLIKSAVETGVSRAAYLDGSFGSGKCHFMAVLHAILRGDPDARGKKGLADVVAKHDTWLRGRKFLLVPYHMPDSPVAGRRHPRRLRRPRHQELTRARRCPPSTATTSCSPTRASCGQRSGDEKFIAQLPAADEEWGEPGLGRRSRWTPRSPSRRAARSGAGSSATCWPARSSGTRGRSAADQESFIPLDEGLSVISKHAKNVLGYDAVVLLLDELVLWLSGYIGDHDEGQHRGAEGLQAGRVGRARAARPDHQLRPPPAGPARPGRQGRRGRGGHQPVRHAEVLGRPVRPDPPGRPQPARDRARAAAQAQGRRRHGRRSTRRSPRPPASRPQVWETLLDAHGEQGDREAFRSPTRSARRSCTPWWTSPARCSGSGPRSS